MAADGRGRGWIGGGDIFAVAFIYLRTFSFCQKKIISDLIVLPNVFAGEGQKVSSYGSGRLNAELLDAAVARCQAQANQEVEDKAGTTPSHPSSFLCVFRVLQ